MELLELQREILKVPKNPEMDGELIEALTALCFQEEKLTESDVLFVFGSNVQHKEIADLISYMLDQNLVDQVVITGGVANYTGSVYQKQAESERIKSFIALQKYPDKYIYTENKSKNTIENIVEAQKIFSFSNIRSMTFLAHSYASTRCALSLKKYFPGVTVYCIPLPLPSKFFEYPVSKDRWFRTNYGRGLVWGEYLRLQTYGKRGDFPIIEIQDKLDHIEVLTGHS